MKKSLKSGGRFFPAYAEASEMLEPANSAFNSPASAVASQGPPVLSDIFRSATHAVRSDHFHALLRHGGIQLVAVIGFIADKALRALCADHKIKEALHQSALVRTGRGAARGHRQA